MDYIEANKLINSKVDVRQAHLSRRLDIMFNEIMKFIRDERLYECQLYIKMYFVDHQKTQIRVSLSDYLQLYGFNNPDEWRKEVEIFLNRFANLKFQYEWDNEKLTFNFSK